MTGRIHHAALPRGKTTPLGQTGRLGTPVKDDDDFDTRSGNLDRDAKAEKISSDSYVIGQLSISQQAVLETAALTCRPSRAPDYELENRALTSLTEMLVRAPEMLPQKLAELALTLCRADSAGVSIHEPRKAGCESRWDAIAGTLAAELSGAFPQELSPSKTGPQSDAPLPTVASKLPDGMTGRPPIIEALAVPFQLCDLPTRVSEPKSVEDARCAVPFPLHDQPLGILWVLAHTAEKKFELEDQRLLTSLSQVAASGYRMIAASRWAQRNERLYRRQTWLRGEHAAHEAAMQGAPLETSLAALLHAAVEGLGPETQAAFHLADETGTRLQRVVGMPADYVQVVDHVAIGPESLPSVWAIHGGQPILTADVSHDPPWQPWLWLAERFDFRGCWSFPIPDPSGRFVATLTLYFRYPHKANDADLQFVSMLVDASAILISHYQQAEVVQPYPAQRPASACALGAAQPAPQPGSSAWALASARLSCSPEMFAVTNVESALFEGQSDDSIHAVPPNVPHAFRKPFADVADSSGHPAPPEHPSRRVDGGVTRMRSRGEVSGDLAGQAALESSETTTLSQHQPGEPTREQVEPNRPTRPDSLQTSPHAASASSIDAPVTGSPADECNADSNQNQCDTTWQPHLPQEPPQPVHAPTTTVDDAVKKLWWAELGQALKFEEEESARRTLPAGMFPADDLPDQVPRDHAQPTARQTADPRDNLTYQQSALIGINQKIALSERTIAELLASEAKFRGIVNQTFAGVAETDGNGRFLSVNDRFCQITGYSREELIGQLHMQEITSAEDLPKNLDKWHRLLQEGIPFEIEKRYVRKDHTEIWVHNSVSAIRDAAGQVVSLVAICVDISERKQPELELERMRLILSEGQRIAHVGSFEYIVAKGETVWSEEEFRIYGLEPSARSPSYIELRQRHFHPDDVQRLDQVLATALQSGKAFQVEHRIVLADGSVRVLYNVAQPYFDRTGTLIRYIGATLDITERKQAEQALVESESRYRFLTELTSLYQLNDPRSMIDGLCHRLMERLDCDFFLNYLQDPLARKLKLFTHAGLSPENVQRLEWIELGQAICGLVAQEGKEIITKDVQHQDAPRSNLVRSFGLNVYACFPLRSHNLVLGTLFFASSKKSSFSDVEIQLIRTVSLHIAEAISRIQYQQEVRDREENLQAVLKTAVDAIVTIDQTDLISSANRASERMFGYPPCDLIGQHIELLMAEPFREASPSFIRRYGTTADPYLVGWRCETLARRRDGSIFPVELSISEIDHEQKYTVFIRDITERKELQRGVLEAAAEEQRRLGYELHDGIQQELTGLSLFAGLVCQSVQQLSAAPDPSQTQPETVTSRLSADTLQRLAEAAERLSQGLAETHRHVQELAHGILPVQVDADGLRVALESLAESVKPQVNCDFVSMGDVQIADNTTASHVYRIAQEALNNALRHGHADTVHILLLANDDKITLEVIDNGSGLDPVQSTKGMGLQTMEYRASLIGGTLSITRLSRGGTTVRCVFPRLARSPQPDSRPTDTKD